MEPPRPAGDAHPVADGQRGIVSRPQIDLDPAGGILEVDVPAVPGSSVTAPITVIRVGYLADE